MDELVQTVRRVICQPEAVRPHQAILVHIYPTGPDIGRRYVLDHTPLVIGRGEDCQIRINDNSVSRRHVRVQPSGNGYAVTDLGSTNGTLINDDAVITGPLRDGDYLRVGNCIYRFLSGSNIETEYHEEIYRLTIVDGLTGIHNRRYLQEYLERELGRAARHGRPLSLVLFDIDHFKKVNDGLGHLAGDHCLRTLAALVKTQVRGEELFARYGGEEFAFVLPETGADQAAVLAERVRALVQGHPFEFDDEQFRVTISLGVATAPAGANPAVQDLLRAADDALYQAKHAGRNCVRHQAPAASAVSLERFTNLCDIHNERTNLQCLPV